MILAFMVDHVFLVWTIPIWEVVLLFDAPQYFYGNEFILLVSDLKQSFIYFYKKSFY